MKSSIVSSSRPRSVAVGDFNNDHLIDLVVANSATNTIGIFLSQGDGAFAEQKTYPTDLDSHPCSVAVGHLNSDDYVDVAVTNYATNNIGVFFGNGDGTFRDQWHFSTNSSHPLFVTTADVDNDNATDLVVVNYGTNSVGILLGYGNGSFQPHTSYFTEYDSIPHSLALGDFNNDNHLDIAVANYGTSNIGILLGYGDGTFANQTTYTTLSNSHPSSLALGDFNHDHHLDIVVSNNGSGTMGIFFGHGNGTFEVQRIYPLDRHSHPEYITVADMNNDNELDVIIVDSINDRVHIVRGDGNGSFATLTAYDALSESRPVSVGVAHFNNNNQSDIVVINYGTNNVLVLMDYWTQPSARHVNYRAGPYKIGSLAVGDFNSDHIPDIVFSSAGDIIILNGLDLGRSITTIHTSAAGIQDICIGDVNNDNWMDIITANGGGDNVGVLLGGDNGTFGSMTTYSTGSGSVPVQLALGDMNGDGRLDIVCTNYYSNSVGVLLGNGDGTFATMMSCSTGARCLPYPVALGDINSDHHLDIVVACATGNGLLFFAGGDELSCSLTRYPLSGARSPVILADFNSDNHLDIAVMDANDRNVVVVLGDGHGAFGIQTVYPIESAGEPRDAIAIDFNRDEILDLVVSVYNNDEVVIFYGNGDGTFTLARSYSTGFGSKPFDIAVADFDSNNQLEIVVIVTGINGVAVLTEYIAAEFVKQVVYSTGSTPQPFSVAAGDFTHNNRSDVIVVNSGTDDLSVLVGSGNGTFEREMVYKMGSNSQPYYVITCDVDQDQQLDIVSVNSKLNSITVLMGQSDGTFANQTMYSTGNDSHPFAGASADLNNDGRLDLITANEGTDSIGVLFGFNYTTFRSPVSYSSNDSFRPFGIAASDFNNDGFQDIATAFNGNGKIGIYLGCGNGSFILTITYSIGDNARPWSIIASDLNNDDRVDIIVTENRSGGIGILLGYGNGSFTKARMYSFESSGLKSVAVGDWDNDGRLDLIVVDSDADSVEVFFGYGDGTFSRMQLSIIKEDFQADSVVLVDLHNDGRLYIIIVIDISGSTGYTRIYGSGVARNETISATIVNSQPRYVTVADFNRDNRLDMAVTDISHTQLCILLANDDHDFGPCVSYSIGSAFPPTSFDVGDFNNDNILDIVILSFEANGIVVLFGIGDGTFLFGRIFSTGIGSLPCALVIGDFNNDSRLDIAVTNYFTNNIAVFLGDNSEPFGSVKNVCSR